MPQTVPEYLVIIKCQVTIQLFVNFLIIYSYNIRINFSLNYYKFQSEIIAIASDNNYPDLLTLRAL
jgi:hypothetical protein